MDLVLVLLGPDLLTQLGSQAYQGLRSPLMRVSSLCGRWASCAFPPCSQATPVSPDLGSTGWTQTLSWGLGNLSCLWTIRATSPALALGNLAAVGSAFQWGAQSCVVSTAMTWAYIAGREMAFSLKGFNSVPSLSRGCKYSSILSALDMLYFKKLLQQKKPNSALIIVQTQAIY